MKNIYKIVSIIVCICLILFLYSYVKRSRDNAHYETEIVFTSSVTNSFSSNAVVLRKETLIDNLDGKIIDYLVEDGEKVALGDSIANIYDNDHDVKMVYDLKNIDDEIKLLSEVNLIKNNRNITSEVLYNQIENNLGNFINIVDKKILDGFDEVKKDLFISLVKKNLVYGNVFDLNSKISDLNEKRKLNLKLYNNYQTIFADKDGYFSNNIDGYELDLKTDNLLKSNYEECLNIMKKRPKKIKKNDYIGKIISGFDWYILLKTNKKNIDNLGKINLVNVSFKIQNTENIPAVIEDIKQKDGDDQENIIILKSNYMSKDIMKLRKNNVVVSTKSFFGLVVNINALRFCNNQSGVFVKEGNMVKFKKIDPLFETKNKVISQIKPLDSDYLQAFDEVIISGSGLYDGKELSK